MLSFIFDGVFCFLGLPGFYTTFCDSLYNELDKEMPIWVIGHAGHDEPGKETQLKTPSLKGNEELFDLQGQLNHKIEFYNRFIPKDVKIYLIGHSVGAKFCLDLLKIPEFSQQVEQCYMLFPAIERMAESNKGKLVPAYDRFFFLFRVFYNLLHLIPSSWKRSLVAWHCRKEGMVEEFIPPSVEYTNPPVIDKIWFLALDEMKKIREVDEETVRNNMHRLKLYYGTKDDWVRTEYFHDLVKKFPGIDAELCKQEYEHAFVLKNGVEVGIMVSEWMNQKRKIKE